MFRRIRIHPVVRRAGIFPFRRADIRQMLGPCHVIRTATMQVTIWVGLLVQRVGISSTQHLRDHPLVLRFGSVAIHHAVRFRQLRRFIDPSFQWSCHSDPPASPTFRRHQVQSAVPRSLAAPATLWMRTPTGPGRCSYWTRPCQQAHAKAGTSGQVAGFLSLPTHSLCYPSPPTQAASYRSPHSSRHLSLPFLFLLRYYSPAVNSSPLSPHSELDRLRVVLVSPRNPLNIGAAARAMSNFGFLHLRVVNPYELAFREARSAVGAASLLARAEEFKSLAEAVEDCTLVVGTTSVGQRQLQHPVRRLDQAARLLRKHLAGSRVALLFGSEKRGLSNEDLSHCHWLLRIPTREEHRSMNLGQAVAVCLYELARAPQAASKPEKHIPAAAADLERLTALLVDALRSSGYLKSSPSGSQKRRSAAPTEEKIRRLVRRLHLSATDAELTLGILRQILWNPRQDKKLSQ